jgi:hypothetical protein
MHAILGNQVKKSPFLVMASLLVLLMGVFTPVIPSAFAASPSTAPNPLGVQAYTEQATLYGNKMFDIFGSATALSGDGLTAAFSNSNFFDHIPMIFIHNRSTTDAAFTITPTVILTAPSTDNASFGSSLALSNGGLTLLVGQPSGSRVYLYTRPKGSIPFNNTPTVVLNSPDTTASGFGTHVALSGDGLTALVTQLSSTTSNVAGYIYTRTNSNASFGSTPTTTLINPDYASSSGDAYGASLSKDGLTVALSSFGQDNYKGAVYVYTRPDTMSNFSATPVTTIRDPHRSAVEHFGTAVSLSGDGLVLLAGAPSAANGGAAYIYMRGNPKTRFGSTPTTVLLDPTPINSTGYMGHLVYDMFGDNLSLSSDGLTAIVAATQKNNFQGAFYAYTRASHAGSFSSSPVVTVSSPVQYTNPKFPMSGAGFGGTLVVSSDASTVLATAVFAGNSSTKIFQFKGSVATIKAVSSDAQTTAISTTFGTKLSVTVHDGSDKPLAGVAVTFTTPASGASATFSGGEYTYKATTDAQGNATATDLTANAVAGSYKVTAKVAGINTPATFQLTNANIKLVLSVYSGSYQTARPGSTYHTSLTLIVYDTNGKPVPNVEVTFEAPSSSASCTFRNGTNSLVLITDAYGYAEVGTVDANQVIGTYAVTASALGADAPALFLLAIDPNARQW